MTLKHKATGQWAEGAKRSKNPLLKKAINDQVEKSRELMRKMDRMSDSDDSSDVDSDEESESSSEAEETPGKGLMAMKFMQRAQKREREDYEELKGQFDAEEKERVRKLERAAKRAQGEVESGSESGEAEKDTLKGKITSGKKKFELVKSKAITEDRRDVHMADQQWQVDAVAFGSGFASNVKEPIGIKEKTKVAIESDSEESKAEEDEVKRGAMLLDHQQSTLKSHSANTLKVALMS